MSSLKRALQREKRRGLVTQPEEPTQMKGKIEEERRQQTEAGWHQAPKCERWVQEQRDHFRTWWVILGGSGLRNGWVPSLTPEETFHSCVVWEVSLTSRMRNMWSLYFLSEHDSASPCSCHYLNFGVSVHKEKVQAQGSFISCLTSL